MFLRHSFISWRELNLSKKNTSKDFNELTKKEKQMVIAILRSEIEDRSLRDIEEKRYNEQWKMDQGIKPFGKDINDCSSQERKRIMAILKSEFGIIHEKQYKEGVNIK